MAGILVSRSRNLYFPFVAFYCTHKFVTLVRVRYHLVNETSSAIIYALFFEFSQGLAVDLYLLFTPTTEKLPRIRNSYIYIFDFN